MIVDADDRSLISLYSCRRCIILKIYTFDSLNNMLSYIPFSSFMYGIEILSRYFSIVSRWCCLKQVWWFYGGTRSVRFAKKLSQWKMELLIPADFRRLLRLGTIDSSIFSLIRTYYNQYVMVLTRLIWPFIYNDRRWPVSIPTGTTIVRTYKS